MTSILDGSNPRVRPFKILELVSMIKTTQQGIIICSYDNNKTLDFFLKGFRKIISDEEENIVVFENEKNEKTSLSKFISDNSEYNKSQHKLGVISNIYRDNDIPSFEFLNQARSYYTQINHPIIFWFYEPCMQWLSRFAPDFMRVQIGFFKFDRDEVISNSKFLGIDLPKLTQDERNVEFYKKKIVRSYSANSLNDARILLGHISTVLNLELNIKDLATSAVEMIKVGDESILAKINDLTRKQMRRKGRGRLYEDKDFAEYCQLVSEKCEKIGKYDMAKIYDELGTNIDTNLDQLFRAKKNNDKSKKNT